MIIRHFSNRAGPDCTLYHIDYRDPTVPTMSGRNLEQDQTRAGWPSGLTSLVARERKGGDRKEKERGRRMKKKGTHVLE